MTESTGKYHPDLRAQISHHLRIPLAGILGMTHFLEQTPLTLEQQKYVQIIHTSAHRLLDLENLLHTIVQETLL